MVSEIAVYWYLVCKLRVAGARLAVSRAHEEISRAHEEMLDVFMQYLYDEDLAEPEEDVFV